MSIKGDRPFHRSARAGTGGFVLPLRRKRRGFLQLLGLFSRDGFGGPDGTEDASPGHRHGIGLRSLTGEQQPWAEPGCSEDRKSTRLNSSHSQISYAVFCLKKKNNS